MEQARNLLVERFLASPARWLLFVDRDAVVHPLTALRLMSWNVPVVAALAFARTEPPTPTVYAGASPHDTDADLVGYRVNWEETRSWLLAHPELQTNAAVVLAERPDDALVEVDFTGMHCTLIRRDVLERLRPGPWFERVHPIGGPRGAGEDYDFCRRARAGGLRCVCRPQRSRPVTWPASAVSAGWRSWRGTRLRIKRREGSMSQEYEALVPLDHTADHCIYPAGSVVKLDHLSKAQVTILLDRGYVRPIKVEAEAEVKAEK